jgi:hypothetical protein
MGRARGSRPLSSLAALFIFGGLGEALALSTPFVPRAVPVATLSPDDPRLSRPAESGACLEVLALESSL